MQSMNAHTRTPASTALASHRWADLNTRDFAALDPARTVAVLPLGATEQHGPHLPLSVDTVLVDGVVNAALAHLAATDPVLVLPTGEVVDWVHLANNLTKLNQIYGNMINAMQGK